METEAIIRTLDLFGVVVFGIAGALSAKQVKLDLFGVVVVALVTANGGGTLRDVLLGRLPVFWMKDEVYIIAAVIAAIIAFCTMRWREPSRRVLLIADALGLAVFTVIGVEVSLEAGVSPLVAVIMGVMTGTFGGLIRDVLFLQIPLILQREIYATAALLGGIAFASLLTLNIPHEIAISVGIGVTFGIRILSLRGNWSLPRIAE